MSGDIETVEVAPVPEKQRTMTPGKLFIVWLMASASATTPRDTVYKHYASIFERLYGTGAST